MLELPLWWKRANLKAFRVELWYLLYKKVVFKMYACELLHFWRVNELFHGSLYERWKTHTVALYMA